jgi:hypothetical protein
VTLLLGLVFGAIGSGFILYGKKEHDVLILLTGVALAVYPYFFSNVFVVLLIGAVLSMVPVARKKEWF